MTSETRMAAASKRRSTTREPREAVMLIRSSRPSAKARANSPARAGSTLLAMKPMVVAA